MVVCCRVICPRKNSPKNSGSESLAKNSPPHEKVLRIGIAGLGTVAQGLLTLVAENAERIDRGGSYRKPFREARSGRWKGGV